MATEQTEETAAGGKKPKSGAGARSAAKVEHFTPEERAARGKAARAEVPRTLARRVGASAAPPGPGRAARRAGADPCS